MVIKPREMAHKFTDLDAEQVYLFRECYYKSKHLEALKREIKEEIAQERKEKEARQ